MTSPERRGEMLAPARRRATLGDTLGSAHGNGWVAIAGFRWRVAHASAAGNDPSCWRSRGSQVPRSAPGARLDLLSIEGVASLGEAGEGGRHLERARHPDRIEGLLHVEALLGLDVDDLVGGRRRHVDAGAYEWHQQELLHPRRIEGERHDVAADVHPLAVQVLHD